MPGRDRIRLELLRFLIVDRDHAATVARRDEDRVMALREVREQRSRRPGQHMDEPRNQVRKTATRERNP
jgi:hypothetical protein